MNKCDFIEKMESILKCTENTAESLYNSLSSIIGEEMKEVEGVEDKYYKVLKITSTSGEDYWVMIARGFFISSVYKSAINGERIYRAIR